MTDAIMRKLPLLALFLAASPSLAQTHDALTVHIEHPTAGIVDADLVVPFEATVSDPAVRTARLTVNGATYEVPVEGGRVRQQVVAVPGNNRVAITVDGAGRTATDATTFHLRGERVEMVVILSWPSQGEIVDLWVREPDGHTCKWDRRQTEHGRLLDFSANAIGFGSQAYVSSLVQAGRYRVKIHYWSARGHDDERGAWTWESAITHLDAVTERLPSLTGDARRAALDERRTLEHQLDEWSRPGAPQTRVRAEVVLFPNTASELRWRFERDVTRDGQLLTLGEIQVDDATIARARAAVHAEAR